MNAPRAAVAAVALTSAALLACSGAEQPQRAAGGGETSESQFSASVAPKNDSGMQGHVMVSTGADSLTIKLEVLGLEAGTEYPAHLHRGTCERGGEVVAELDPPTVASVGLGSSLSALSPQVMEADASYFVQVHLPDGTPAACANVEKPTGT